jgi:hypothetical protein
MCTMLFEHSRLADIMATAARNPQRVAKEKRGSLSLLPAREYTAFH